jgi:hypothetical protein
MTCIARSIILQQLELEVYKEAHTCLNLCWLADMLRAPSSKAEGREGWVFRCENDSTGFKERKGVRERHREIIFVVCSVAR